MAHPTWQGNARLIGLIVCLQKRTHCIKTKIKKTCCITTKQSKLRHKLNTDWHYQITYALNGLSFSWLKRKRYAPLKYVWITTRLYCVTSYETTLFIVTAVATSNPKNNGFAFLFWFMVWGETESTCAHRPLSVSLSAEQVVECKLAGETEVLG
jgi:hypothetical protein